MELFGIVLSIPVALVACTGYCFLLAKVVGKKEGLSRGLRYGAYIVLGAFLVEVLLLGSLGAVRSRVILGPAFYICHLLIFFFGPPALANALVLRRGRFRKEWYVAAVLCTIFAFSLVLLQYGVSEALYGIDGENGPFSQATQ